jgi:hypothetical protein
MLGPLVLAALTNESDVLRADANRAAQWVVLHQPVHLDRGRTGVPCGTVWAIWGCTRTSHDEATVKLMAVGEDRNYTLLPLGRIAHQNYTAFLNVSLSA